MLTAERRPEALATGLRQQQNPDGGWSYRHGGSWTEPTVYAVLALHEVGETAATARGVAWLQRAQQADGGWQARPGVGESCWVTSLAALLPVELLGPERHRRSVAWISATTGVESTALYRVRQWLLGSRPSPETVSPGWPWVTGSAAWVSPTSLAVLALGMESRLHPSPELTTRIDAGRRFLLNRMCKGGGWNHGSVRALGYESDAYPETTGMALAALRGLHGQETEQSLQLAQRMLRECRSADAMNWLRLGLAAHGKLPDDFTPLAGVTYRTVPEAATSILADRAVAGRSAFWV